MLHDALELADDGPVVIRYPRGAARQVGEHEVGAGLLGRRVIEAEIGSGRLAYEELESKSLRVAEIMKELDLKIERWFELGEYV